MLLKLILDVVLNLFKQSQITNFTVGYEIQHEFISD